MKVFVSILMICAATLCFAQKPEKTEIYIIGNIHDSVPNYNPGILYDILEKIRPDIILHEVDQQGMMEYNRDLALTGNEIQASNRYLERHPATLRFPFDFEGRNAYRKKMGMVPTDNLTVKLIDSLHREGALKPDEEKIYLDFLSATDQLTIVAQLSPENFNSAITDSLARLRQDLQYTRLFRITAQHSEFESYKVIKPDGKAITYRDGFRRMASFWDLRNQTMAQNIFNIAKGHKQTRIVVLTGFLHRYYIISELQKLNRGNFILKKFLE